MQYLVQQTLKHFISQPGNACLDQNQPYHGALCSVICLMLLSHTETYSQVPNFLELLNYYFL